jgi:membrane associated rhomboid family serine protease
MTVDMRMVYESRNRAECSDRALVLAALQIPFQIVDDVASCALVVPAEHSAQAMQQLMQYDDENPPRTLPAAAPLVHYSAMAGLIGYVLVICAVAVIADFAPWGRDWYLAGRVDGALIRAGEWWRTITALTLHSGLEHLAGNLAFGIMFGLFAGRLLGSGVAWLAIIVAAASGNALNTLLLDTAHRAIGASTAVFAALGLVAGFVWRGKLMAQDRWPYRLGPIVGGFALLMYTGTGGENTDIGAHLMGFLCGLGAGMLLTVARHQLGSRQLQLVCGFSAIALICGAWLLAIG